MILTPDNNNNLLRTIVEFTYAEYGSALEMLIAAKKVQSPKLKLGYIRHAIDEFRHARLLTKVLSNQVNNGIGTFEKDFKFIPGNVVKKGYLDKNGFLIEKLNLKKFVEFVYSNEFLAKEAFDKLALRIKDANSVKFIESIRDDEEGHADISMDTLDEIMEDEKGHHGHAKSYYKKNFPKSNIQYAFFREKLKNRFRTLYLKNFKFLTYVIDPLAHLLIKFFGKTILLVKVPDTDKMNLMKSSSSSII